MQYRLRWSERSLRRLRTLPEWLRREILLIVQALRSDPYPPTAEPLLRELKGYWKLKVNGYRVIYRVNDDDKVIFVRVRKRNRNTYLSL